MQDDPQDKTPEPIVPDGVSQTANALHPSRIHAFWILFLIWFFPPYAWHNMWMHKKYHHWFPILSFLNSFLLLIPSVIYVFYTYPSLSALSKNPPVPVQAVYPLIAFAI